MAMPSELEQARQAIQRGETQTVTVRDLLAWFGVKKRGRHVVGAIRSALRKAELVTVPDFDGVWIDAPVQLMTRGEKQAVVEPVVTTVGGTEPPNVLTGAEDQPTLLPGSTSEVGPVRTLEGHDPSYSVGKLAAANNAPESVPPGTSVREAITRMLARDFSQLPVMQGDRSLKGLFSWKSLASRLALGQECRTVSDAMDDVQTVSAEASIFQVAELLSTREVLLVQESARNNRIVGILTSTDLAEQFHTLGEPFLLIGEIENRLRVLLDGKVSLEVLKSVRDPSDASRPIEGIGDLTFGEYVRLLQNPDHWNAFGLPVDRAVFTEKLDEIRKVRNDVMHFDPDGVDSDDLEKLRQFARFLARLAQLVLAAD